MNIRLAVALAAPLLLALASLPARAADESAPPSETVQLIEALKSLHPDEMSPREALEALYALKAKLPKQ